MYANGVFGTGKICGYKYVVGREVWKGMVVNKLMYGCGALAGYQKECYYLEIRQNGIGQMALGCGEC